MRGKAMIRLIVALLVGLLVFVDVAPALAQNQGTVLMAQEAKRRTLFDLLFGEPEAPPAPVTQPRRQTQQAAPAALPPPKPQVEKAPDATRLAVFGDSLAIDLSRALERFYAEDPNLVVLDQGVSSSGFVRADYFDWDKAISEQIAADSFDLAVVIIGINDRQELTVNGQSYAPLTEPWNAAYQARIASFLGRLRAARKPVIWVGLPPMAKSEYSAAISQISNIQRLASFSGGAEFLDIYERFLGEDGKYSSHGPDVNGQNARMRKDDGIHFSAAGSDKLAFYLNQTIRAFYRGGGVSIAVADPLLGTDAAAMLRPPYQGLGQIRLLEVAGAVVPISRVPARAGDLLLASDMPSTTPPFTLEQLVTAPIGRVDAFGVGIDPTAEPVKNTGGR
ncbi:SGNH/GDSL hydrolase family protein [Devosia sp. A369]